MLLFNLKKRLINSKNHLWFSFFFSVLFFLAPANAEQCAATFIDGLTNSDSSGKIKFENSSQLLNNPDTILATTKVEHKNTNTSCESANCSASGSIVPKLIGSYSGYSSSTSLEVKDGASETITQNDYKDVKVKNTSTLTMSSNFSSYSFKSLKVENTSIVNLTAGDYYFEKLEIKSTSQLNVIGSGTARIYVKNSISLKDLSTINGGASGDPSKLFIFMFADGDKIEIKNSTTVAGYIYSESKVEIKDGTTKVFGAISAAGEIKLKNSVTVTYDASGLDSANFGSACDSTSAIAEYRFDELSYSDVANEIIDSIAGLNGQAKSSQPVTGKVCNAIDLSATGTKDYAILSADTLSGKTDFTISLWAKTAKTTTQSMLSGANSGSHNELLMWFYNDISFKPYLKNRQNGTIAITSIADDSWHHLVWTRAGSQSCLYRDKIFQGCKTQSTDIVNIASLILGQEQDSVGGGFDSAQAFDGLIDELVVFDGAISADDITTIYENQNAGKGYDGSSRTCPTVPLTPPVLDMRFDESSWSGAAGEVIDETGNFNASAINGANTQNIIPAIAGNPGTCRYGSFDGIDDYVEIADNPLLDLETELSITVWINTDSIPSSGLKTILSKDDNYEFHVNSSGEIFWWWSAHSFTTSNVNMVPNTWYHIAITYKSGEQIIYVNGVARASRSYPGDLSLNNDPLQIGQDQNFSGRYFNGLIDEVQIYSGVLSSIEINDIYQATHPCTSFIDHFEIIHDGQGLTCDVEPITIKACADVSCSTLSQDAVDVVLSINGSVDKTITVSGGSTDSSFSFTSAGTASLSLDQSYVCANGSSSSCDVYFADTGFRFYANSVNTSIPTQLSAKPSNTGFNASSLYVQAIKTNGNTGACEAALIDSTVVEMVAQCENPTSCAGKHVVIGNGSSDVAISSVDNGVSLTYTSVSLDFGDNSENAAPFVFTYPDAGQLRLTARANIVDENGNHTGVYMSGSSNSFVVRPLGFYTDIPDNKAAETANDVTCPGGECAFKKAGENFITNITAMQWHLGDDSNNDGIADSNAVLSNNTATVNFGQETSPETAEIVHSLILPNGGASGTLAATSFSNFTHGVSSQQLNWSEVGIIDFTINLSDNHYLGVGDVSSYVPFVGRFIPDHFEIAITAEGTFSATCEATTVAQNFVYSGQLSIDTPTEGLLKYGELPTFTLIAKTIGSDDDSESASSITKNYTGDFIKLQASGSEKSVTHATLDEDTSTVDKEGNKIALTADINNMTFVDESNGEVSVEYSVDDNFIYTHDANAEVIPFPADIDLSISSIIDTDGVVAADSDGDSHNSTVLTLNPVGMEVRYGRFYIDNSFGPETADLPQKLSSQYLLTGTTYVTNIDDNCTAYDMDDMSLTAGTIAPNGHFIGPLFPAPPPPDTGLLENGVTRVFFLNKTGVQGNVNVLYDTLPWLKHDWDTSDFAITPDQNPSAVATFGIFRGNDRIIYQREVGN